MMLGHGQVDSELKNTSEAIEGHKRKSQNVANSGKFDSEYDLIFWP